VLIVNELPQCGGDMLQLIDYGQFRRFLTIYLEVEIPDDLSRHLFLSFLKRPTSSPAVIARNQGDLCILFSSNQWTLADLVS